MIEWDPMGKSQYERVADKIIALLADGRISQSEWRHWIPDYITSNNKMIVANAKNLADGINEEMERKQIGISKELNFDYQTGHYNGQ